jgi:hypothetical protein
MFKATAQRLGDPEPEGRTTDTADNAARQLFILLKFAGWTEAEDKTVARLVTGEPLEFKGFSYKVTEQPSQAP